MDECAHMVAADRVEPSGTGCVECLAIGARWVHLRLCTACGHVGCCDSSPNRHASAHAGATSHPVVRSFEPGEAWWYCFPDDLFAAEREGWPPARDTAAPR